MNISSSFSSRIQPKKAGEKLEKFVNILGNYFGFCRSPSSQTEHLARLLYQKLVASKGIIIIDIVIIIILNEIVLFHVCWLQSPCKESMISIIIDNNYPRISKRGEGSLRYRLSTICVTNNLTSKKKSSIAYVLYFRLILFFMALKWL